MDVFTVLKQLKEPATVTFESSPGLAGQVRQRAKKIDDEMTERGEPPQERKLELGPVAELNRRDGMSISPWELLHTLARATAMITNQGVSSRALAQHWECLRFVIALQSNGQGRMELSQEGLEPKFHKKAVQAQDLGVAFGLSAAKHIMEKRHHDYRFDVVDAEFALEAGWALQGYRRTKMWPNYFLVGRRPGAPLRLVSVDCRGSHSSIGTQHDQLARSAPRVQAIVLGELDTGGAPPPSLLVATGVAAKGGIEIRILDPDSDGILAVPGKLAPDLAGPVDELNILPEIHFTNPDGNQESRPGFTLPSEQWEWFSRVLARTTAAALLTFAGDRGNAHSLLTKRQQDRLGTAHSHISPGMQLDTGITLAGMKFIGTDHVFRLDGQRMEVFSGLFEHMHSLLKYQKFDDYESALPTTLSSWKQRKSRAENEWRGILHLDSAGALMAIRRQDSRGKPLR